MLLLHEHFLILTKINMKNVKLVYRLAVIAIFLGGFLIGGSYVRFLDSMSGYNAEMVQSASTRYEQSQTKCQDKTGGKNNIMVQPVTTQSNIMVQPVTQSSNIMVQPIVESTDIMVQP